MEQLDAATRAGVTGNNHGNDMTSIHAKMQSTCIFAFTSACIATAVGSAHAQVAPPAPVSLTENTLALDLYKELRNRPGNLLLSPYSIERLVGMVYAGAEGDTASEIAIVLRGAAQAKADEGNRDANRVDIDHTSGREAEALVTGQPKGFTFHVANALWVAEDVKLNRDFSRTIQKDFNGTSQRVDFSNAQASADTINRWTRRNTDGKIPSILDAGMLSPAPRIVLTDAVYFKARWASPFEKSDTVEHDFHITAGTTAPSEMMFQSGYFDFVETGNAKVLALRYTGNVSMVIILPDRQDGLADLEAGLTAECLNTWLVSARTRQVEISLPKFQSTTSVDLGDALKTLGMRKAFIPGQADFAGIAGSADTPLYIGRIVHEAFIDTDEGGTEAAASTAATGMVGAAPPSLQEPVRFVADHSFLYVIRDDDSGAILFIGRITNPAQQDGGR